MTVKRKLGHAYADDHRVYCSFHPDSMDSDYESMERCISDIKDAEHETENKLFQD